MNTTCQFYLRGVALLRFDEVSSGKSSKYLMTAMRILKWFTDSLSFASHADELPPRVGADVIFSPFLVEGSLLENCGAKSDLVSGLVVFWENIRGFSVRVAVRTFGFPLVVTPSIF